MFHFFVCAFRYLFVDFDGCVRRLRSLLLTIGVALRKRPRANEQKSWAGFHRVIYHVHPDSIQRIIRVD
jgi:hypothetical protein